MKKLGTAAVMTRGGAGGRRAPPHAHNFMVSVCGDASRRTSSLAEGGGADMEKRYILTFPK